MASECNLESSLIKAESSVELFKVPHGLPPRKKVKILNEEAYITNLQEIIERDFFPNLENLRDKLEYVEACENHDVVKLREIYAKFSNDQALNLQLPEESPATFDTPDSHRKSENSPPHSKSTSELNADDPKARLQDDNPKKLNENEKLSLDKFMMTHTSEDNKNFEKIMEDRQRKFMAKHPWLFESEDTHNKLHAPNLQLLSIEDQQKNRDLSLTATIDENKDIRPKNVENWSYKTFNSVMFVPDGAEMSKEKQLELAKVKSREIIHSNTRYTESPFNEELSQAAMLEASAIQAYKKEGKVGVDGKELKETPKVNGYSYVKMPSPMPGVDESPLMTWGQLDGTPMQLEGSQTPLMRKATPLGPSYKIPKISVRDELLLKLTEKTSQNKKDKKSKALSTARSSFTSPASPFLSKSSAMSPAAQRLLSSKLSSRNTDIALRASYTPSPISLRDEIKTPKLGTPKTLLTSVPRHKNNRHTVSTPGLTDNLLKLPLKHPESSPLRKEDESKNELSSNLGLTDNLLQLPKKAPNKNYSETNKTRKSAADFF